MTDCHDKLTPPRSTSPIIIGLSIVLGVQLWLLVGRGLWGPNNTWLAIAAAVVASLVAPVRRGVTKLIAPISRPTERLANVLTLFVGVASFLYLCFDVLYQRRVLSPQWHDEHVYVIQSLMLSHGWLTLPSHPHADFFESFYLFARPVYAPMYFPGTALVHAAGQLLELPGWIVSISLTAGAAAILYRLALRLIDGVNALLAPLMFLSISEVRLVAPKVISHPLMMLLAPAMVTAYFAFRRRPTVAKGLTLGFIAGLGAITRPVDAAACALPLAIALACDLISRHTDSALRRNMSRCLLWGCVATLPLIMMQAVLNYRVTGNVLRTPHQLYVHTNQPGVEFGNFSVDRSVRPASALPQVQTMYDQVILPMSIAHTPERFWNWLRERVLPQAVLATIPEGLVIVLLPAGIIACARKRRWLIAASVPIWLVAYLFAPFYLRHYAVVIAPAMTLVVLFGKEATENAWPRARHVVAFGMSALLVVSCAGSLPEFDRVVRESFLDDGELAAFRRAIATIADRPALVFVKFSEGDEPESEMVYNSSAARIDDARVVIAHDLRQRDIELIRYYDSIGQNRKVYQFIRSSRTMIPLGTTRELASKGV